MSIRISASPDTAGSEDLVDNAVVNTVMNGGEVHVLEEQMPNGSDMAAVFRY